MRILLVEDDELVADAVIRGLSASGFTVDHAGSAEAARSALAAEHFDLAVVDIGLPGADGLSLLARLRGAGDSVDTEVHEKASEEANSRGGLAAQRRR